MKNRKFCFFLYIIIPLSMWAPQNSLFAQNATAISWWKPSDSPFPTVDGQFWSGEMQDSLFRLPPRARAFGAKTCLEFIKKQCGSFHSVCEQCTNNYGQI